MTRGAVDLFGGPGGWAEALRQLGIVDLGIELDPAACETRRAAGHGVIRADVATVDPRSVTAGLDVEGLIGSPPCPLYSAAGGKQGRLGFRIMAEAMARMVDQPGIDHRPAARQALAEMLCPIVGRPEWDAAPTLPLMPTEAEIRAESMAAEAALVLEPLRWALALRPEWIAFEQVPPVLPLWQAMAQSLGRLGYESEVGILNAADYGVPQTRRRAILVARRTSAGPVRWPTPTHAEAGAGGLLPWVSMGDALGWGGENTDEPWKPGGDRADAQQIPDSAPAPTLTAKAGGQWFFDRPATTIAGDSRVWPPGHKINADDVARLGVEEATARYGDRAGTEAIRLEVPHALVLQGFPADYPVQGSKTEAFQQIGNAVPPPLALAVIRAALGEL